MTDYRDQLNHKLKMHHHPPVPDSSDFSSDSDDTDSNTDSSDLDSDSGVEPNYECVECNTEIHIESEHKQTTMNWCDLCGDVKRHQRMDEA